MAEGLVTPASELRKKTRDPLVDAALMCINARLVYSAANQKSTSMGFSREFNMDYFSSTQIAQVLQTLTEAGYVVRRLAGDSIDVRVEWK
jgi:hypothetical protein